MDAGVIVDDGSIEPINIMAMVGASIVSPIFTPEDINSSGCDHDGSYEEKHLTNPFSSLILYNMKCLNSSRKSTHHADRCGR